jgi:folylpolyglutamate synthase/dihydropteroate synthase
MQIVAFLYALFEALASIKAIAEYVKQLAEMITLWYITNHTSETMSKIADAAALSNRAKTKEDRQNALLKWREALNRSRYLN